MSEMYALLIGVDFYFEHALPDGSYFPSLGGCVRDISHVETFLTDPARLKIAPDHIFKLTSSNGQGDEPVEPREQWPTYENMVAKFKELTDVAQPGDQVFIQYSGHGGRATTIYPQLKDASGLDEALVPLDIGDPQARYLRDVELFYLIQEMVKKQLRLTVVFDSCHSGGATRGRGGAVKRGIGTVDTTIRPTDSLVAPAEALSAAWESRTRGQSRAARAASGWLLEPKGYTFLAACRANESAFEYPFNGRESNGALTYWMLDSLRQAGPNLTYKMLHDRILAKVHGQFEDQTPLIQGEGDWRVFGSDRIPAYYAVSVRKVEGDRVQVDAGDVHGIAVGTQFAVYPHGAADFSRTENRIALLEVSQVNPVDSWAKVVERNGQATLDAGAQAILLNSTNLRLQRDVALVINDAALRQQVESAIAEQGHGFIAVATGDKSDFQVAVNEQQEFEIWDAAGTPLANLRPAIKTDEPDAVKRLVERLVHLAKFYNVRELVAPNVQVAERLEVTLTREPAVAGNAGESSGGVPIFHPGDEVKLTIKNTQPPGAANDPARILNVTVLDLASDWSITQIYPSGAGAFQSIDPGQVIPLEFEAYLPDGYTDNVDTLKIFATQATTNFHWLELPPLDQPAQRNQIRRSLITDPLEKLLATVTDEETTERAIRLTSSPQDPGWTVAQVELQVKEQP